MLDRECDSGNRAEAGEARVWLYLPSYQCLMCILRAGPWKPSIGGMAGG